MGGELQVESVPGKGSKFSFTVAVAAGTTVAPEDNAQAALAAGESAKQERRTSVVHVLLAEDNKVNQTVATRMLQKLGCTVTVAADGAEAVEFASRREFDLILMDCHMPNMDGFAATAAIRAMERGGSTHRIIVAQTANAMEGDRETCLKASMDDYVTKPFTSDTLANVLKRWVPGAGV